MASTVCHFSPLVQRMCVCGPQVAKVYTISEPTGSEKRCSLDTMLPVYISKHMSACFLGDV